MEMSPCKYFRRLDRRSRLTNGFTRGHCTIANFIQATLFNGQGENATVAAQITFEGSSVEPEGFDCESFLGPVQNALEATPFETAGQAINGVSVICSILES